MKIDVANTELSRRGVSKLVGTLGFLLALILFAGLAFSALATAPPTMPHRFYGDVIGAPPGSSVSARIDTTVSVTTTVDADGTYGYGEDVFNVPADDPATPEKDGGEEGDKIKFYVGGVLAECSTDGGATWQDDYAFESGGATELDLRPKGVLPIGVDVSKELVEPVDGTAAVSETVQFQVVMTNTGETAWVSGSFTDTFDACLTFQDVSVVGYGSLPVDPVDNTVSGDLVFPTPIEPDQAVTATLSFIAEEEGMDCCNQVMVTVTDADEQEASAEAQACVDIGEFMYLYLPFVVKNATMP